MSAFPTFPSFTGFSDARAWAYAGTTVVAVPRNGSWAEKLRGGLTIDQLMAADTVCVSAEPTLVKEEPMVMKTLDYAESDSDDVAVGIRARKQTVRKPKRIAKWATKMNRPAKEIKSALCDCEPVVGIQCADCATPYKEGEPACLCAELYATYGAVGCRCGYSYVNPFGADSTDATAIRLPCYSTPVRRPCAECSPVFIRRMHTLHKRDMRAFEKMD